MTMLRLMKKLDSASLRKVIETDCPKLAIRSFHIHDHGMDHVVAEVNGVYMFRFPRNANIQLDVERKALDLLRGKITLQIPLIEFVGKSADYIGYKKIRGVRLTNAILESLTSRERARLVSDLAHFLHEIHHSMTVAQGRAIGLRHEQPRSYHEGIAATLKKKIKDLTILAFLNETVAAYQSLNHSRDRLVFLYNDLHNDNMAFDLKTKRLVGIFDFGDVAVGDIHLDFHPLYKFNQHLMEEVVRAYKKLARVRLSTLRIITYARINELSDLAAYIDQPKSRVYTKAMVRIRSWQGGHVINKD